jgi:hypothetical protein
VSRFKIPAPYFSVPPQEYEPSYFSDLVRNFAGFVHIVSNPGEERGTRMTLTNLPENDSGLETGALFQQSGVVYITRLDISRPAGAAGTGSVGSVTVTTT